MLDLAGEYLLFTECADIRIRLGCRRGGYISGCDRTAACGCTLRCRRPAARRRHDRRREATHLGLKDRHIKLHLKGQGHRSYDPLNGRNYCVRCDRQNLFAAVLAFIRHSFI